MDSLYRVVAAVSDAVWGPWTIFLLPGTGLIGLSGVVAAMLRSDRGAD